MEFILRCVRIMGQISQVCKGGRLEGTSMTRSLIRSSCVMNHEHVRTWKIVDRMEVPLQDVVRVRLGLLLWSP
jgi:hypothetical protein